MRAGGYRSGVAAPVRARGRLWGAVLAATTGSLPMAPEAEQRLAQFAELVSLAIGNAEGVTLLRAVRPRFVIAFTPILRAA